MYKKRGLSSVITIVVLIILILAAGVVIWIVVRNAVNEGNENRLLNNSNIDLKISQVENIDGNTLNITVKMNQAPEVEELVALNFIVDDGTTTEVIRINNSMQEEETQSFLLNFIQLNASKVDKISITPIFMLKTGEEILGVVEDEYITPNTCSNYCPLNAQCGFSGCGMKCGPGCAPGYFCLSYKCIKETSSSGGGGGSSDDSCTNTCASLVYQCGIHNICNSNVNCGSCSTGYNCVSGLCLQNITCTDTCSSLGYECGTRTICGSSVNCGSCSSGYSCNSLGKCIPQFTGTIYYVSNNLGNDSNNGTTPSSPWKTLTYAETHATTPGSVIALRKGDVWSLDNYFEITHGGTVDALIIWDGGLWGPSGASKATIRSNSDGGNYPKGFSLVHIANCDYLTMQRIIFDGAEYERNGLVIGGTTSMVGQTEQNDETNITIQDCELYDFGHGASYNIAFLQQTWNNDMYNITFQRNIVDGASNHCVCFYAGRANLGATESTTHNVYAGYNNITNCGKKVDDAGSFMFVKGGYDSVLIERNKIVQGNGLVVGFGAESYGGHEQKKITIRYNDIRMTNRTALQIQGSSYLGCGSFDYDIYNNLLYREVIPANEGPYPTQDGAVNILGCDYVAGSSLNFSNNVIVVENGGYGFHSHTATQNMIEFRNNIIVRTGDNGFVFGWAPTAAAPAAHSNNVYYKTTGDNSSYWVEFGGIRSKSQMAAWEPTAILENPLLVNLAGFNWHLQSGSPAIDAGVNVGLTKDFDGNTIPRGSAPDIGAYEYVSGPKTYYVSTSGSDSNNGLTQSTPWKTLSYAESHATEPGSIIALKKGDVWTGATCLHINHGGSAGSPILWDGNLWGTGAKAIIRSTGTTDRAIVRIADCSYVNFQNITVDGDGTRRHGLVIGGPQEVYGGPHDQNNEHDIIVQDSEILDCGDEENTPENYNICLLVQPWDNSDMSNIIIRRNRIDGATNWGIAFYPGRSDLIGSTNTFGTNDSYIGYNNVSNCGMKGDGVGVHIGAVGKQDNLIIEHNTITQGARGTVPGLAVSGGQYGSPKNVIIRYNDVRMRTAAAYLTQNGYDPEALIYNNLFYSQYRFIEGEIWWSGVIHIMANAPYTNGANLEFYNNVIVFETGLGLLDDSGTPNTCTFKNNIVINTGDNPYNRCIGVLVDGSTVHDHNLYYRTQEGSNFAYAGVESTYYCKEIGQYPCTDLIQNLEPTAVIADPKLVNLNGFDWHLQPTSPAIDAGINVGLPYSGSAPDIGAYEYS